MEQGCDMRKKAKCNFCEGTGTLFNWPCFFCGQTGVLDAVDSEMDEFFGTETAKVLRGLDGVPNTHDGWRALHVSFLKALNTDRLSGRLRPEQVQAMDAARQRFTAAVDNRAINSTAACMQFLLLIDATLTPEQHGYAPF